MASKEVVAESKSSNGPATNSWEGVQAMIEAILAEDPEAQDGGSANFFPAFLDGVNRWHQDITATLQAHPELTEIQRKECRTKYFDLMFMQSFGELRDHFINQTDSFADEEDEYVKE